MILEKLLGSHLASYLFFPSTPRKREGENSESGLVLRGPNPWNLSHPVTDVQQQMSWPHVSQLEGYWPEEGYKETGPILHGKGDPAALSWLKEAACSWEDGEGFILKRCRGWPVSECDRCSLLFCSTWVFHFLLLPWVKFCGIVTLELMAHV